MTKHIILLTLAGLLTFACAGRAQYTLELTGVGDGAVSDGVYISPYQGVINQGGKQIFSGYMICDDFADESYLKDPWTATATNAGALNGTEMFTTSNTSYTVQQNYDAVAWLANQLLLPGNVTNPTTQTDISFAIWDIMDGQTTNPDGGTPTWIANAFNEVVSDNYVGTNVTVYTPNPNGGPGHSPSQEFLVVTTPEASTPILFAIDLLGFVALVGFLRKRQARAY